MANWLDALRAECARTTQVAAARKLGVSPAMVTLVLKGVYPADTTNLEYRVRGILLGEQVACPVVGDLPILRCLENQADYPPKGPLGEWFKRACPVCGVKDNGKRGGGK